MGVGSRGEAAAGDGFARVLRRRRPFFIGRAVADTLLSGKDVRSLQFLVLSPPSFWRNMYPNKGEGEVDMELE